MLPIIVAALVLVGLMVGGYNLFKDKNEVYITALGLKGSGKTTFQKAIRKLDSKKYATTSEDEFEEVTITQKDKKITIKKGKDVSGAEETLRTYTKSEIEKSDVIFCLFHTKDFLNDADYKKNTLSYFTKNVTPHIKDDKKLIFIGTHTHELTDRRNNQSTIKSTLIDTIRIKQPHLKTEDNQFLFLDLLNKKEVDILIDNLFT